MPLNPSRFWNQLLPLIDEQRVTPVIGQELLRIQVNGETVLVYEWLARRLAEELGLTVDAGAPAATLNAVVCSYIDQGQPIDDVYIAIKRIMSAAASWAVPDALVKLAEISSFKLFVSTTFDGLLERAVNQVRGANRAPAHALVYSLNSDFEDLPDALPNLDRPVVYQLMGRISAIKQTYAVTDEDVLEFVHNLQMYDRRPKRLFDTFAEGYLLLIGNGFAGWPAKFLLRTLKDKQRLWSVRDKVGFVADADVNDDADLQAFLHHFSGQTLVYPGGGIFQFVDELRQRWGDLHPDNTPPVAAQPDGVPPQAVFLSYASEDRAIVDAVRRELDADGIDTWFDRTELHAGDVWIQKIKAGIDGCSVFIPVISRSVLRPQAREFRAEWEEALEALKRRPREADGSPARFIIPVVVDDIDMQADGVRPYFGAFQAQTLPGGRTTPEFRAAVKFLVRRAQKAAEAP